VNKYLHTVAFVGFLFTLNYDARNQELKIWGAVKDKAFSRKLRTVDDMI